MATKTQRLEARVSPDEFELVCAAADTLHLSVSAFVVSAAAREARAVLDEAHTIRLSPETYDKFLAELDEPAAAIPELVDLFKKHL